MLRSQKEFDAACDDLATAIESLTNVLAQLSARSVASLRRTDGAVLYGRHKVRDVRIRFDRLVESIPAADRQKETAA